MLATDTEKAPPHLTAALIAAEEAEARRLAAALAQEGIASLGPVTEEQLAGLAPAPDAVVLWAADGATRRAAAIRRIRAAVPGVVVVAVGSEARGHEVRSTLEAGAGGFVFEAELEPTLGLTVRAGVAGLVSVPWRERRQLVRPSLSAREKQILGLVVMGYMNCEIADRLYLAESTVKSHLSSAFAKLGVRSRNEAVDLILDAEDGLGRGILAITGTPDRASAPATAA